MVESLEATFQFNFDVLIPLAMLAAAVLLGYTLDKLLQVTLAWLMRQSEQPMIGVLASALDTKIFLAILLLGVIPAAVAFFDTPGLVRTVRLTITISLVVLGTIFVMQLATGLVTVLMGSTAVASTSILNNVIRTLVLTTALITVLGTLGISITPLLGVIAGSSVGLTLALQQPLSNLFAGMMLLASNKVQPGDYIRLATGEEGYITDILWHTTYVRALPNNIICVPNAVMVSAIMTNFNQPALEMSVLVDLAVEFHEDLERVEQVTIEVASEVMREVAGGVPEFNCAVYYNTVQDYAVGFTVVLRSAEFVNQFIIKHEFIKRLMKRYRDEQINVAFPVRGMFQYHANWTPEANGSGTYNAALPRMRAGNTAASTPEAGRDD